MEGIQIIRKGRHIPMLLLFLKINKKKDKRKKFPDGSIKIPEWIYLPEEGEKLPFRIGRK